MIDERPQYSEQIDTERVKRFQYILSSSTQDLISKAGLAGGETVLDVGCGDGAVSLLLAERVGETGRVYALDMCEEKLARLTERAASRGIGNIRPLHGRAEEILPNLGGIDAVYSRFVLMHVDNPQRLLTQVQAVLVDGGRAILEEPIIRATYDHPPSGIWERAIAAYRKVCAAGKIDPDYGLKLPRDIAANSFELRFAQQIQPVLSAEVARGYLIAAVEGHREDYLANGTLSLDDYTDLLDAVNAYSDGILDYCAFHGVMQVIGVKV